MSDAGGQDGQEKSHDPTPQRLDRARREGDVPRSLDAAAAAGYVGLLVAILADGPGIIMRTGDALAAPFRSVDQLLISSSPRGQFMAWANDVAAALSPLFLVPLLAVILSLVAQRAFAPAGEKLIPKLSRISLIATAKQKFGRAGLVEFLKSVVKLVALAIALTVILIARLDEIVGAARAGPNAAALLMGSIFMTLLLATVAITGLIALIDLIWQQIEHRHKLRMSFQELRDEMKESEGDPYQKSARRARAEEIATNRMLADVPKADVIIVNPTHYAVALHWSRAPGSAPIVSAKGTDEIAARIREIAAEHGIPIHSDPPTARAIHATVKIGMEIPEKQYRAVAAALRYAEQVRAMSRAARS
ncbi:flagellar biosynthetic protein FlhB [Rubricella aquisinus]|uniref:Flagellar biosynthetic protein FlhB n=1 Tax=Rubricella aquisinus TaxID=2028108 RepID=A0A840WJG2_9RHOB|nr:flagellar type III secretion system protein FlhB [Rubricella aquisinus]MBB5515238.1 flagellar biosynthetic protein FlhB [Rubricella aquisinus]